MVEYGNGVSQGTSAVGGGHATQQLDAGAAFGQFVSNSIHTISTMPPGQLLLLALVVVIGFVILRRAF